jgi:murein DD-endopeptidase MepM/ murein hydrolase activator NlpD
LASFARISATISATIALAALSACRPAAPPARPIGAAGHWYTVQPGETLDEIAARAGVPVEDLLEINGLRGASEDPPPGAPGSGAPQDEAGQRARPGTVDTNAGDRDSARFRWPVDSPRMSSGFGTRWGRSHEGIDLTAPIGTPVLAAGSGEVVYSGGALRGYGNMVVLKHDEELMTVYAHNSVLCVKVGQRVRTGQRIALSGQSGHVTGPHVHFEVRKGQVPRDPLPYLPDLRTLGTPRERTPRS